MMRQASFAPAAPMNAVRLTIAALAAMAVIALALLSVPETASADDNTNVKNCSAVLVNIVCVGQINGNDVNVDIGNVGSGNNLNVLTTDLENVFLSVVNISDINILSADLTAAVTTLVNTTVTNSVTNTVNTITRNCAVVVTPPATTGPSAITITCS